MKEESVILTLFAAMLLGCVAVGLSVLYAMAAGLLLFSGYALRRGFRLREVLGMWGSGVRTAKNVLISFCIIGCLTGTWRVGGTIPAIVYYASGLIRPSVFYLVTFLLNSGLSFLMGTSFGTAGTMGLICMTIGRSLGVSVPITGGAVLAGVYFGDRCSPVSTSALLVSEITGTSLYRNIRNMVRTALVPFVLSCAFFFVLGFHSVPTQPGMDVRTVFSESFNVSWPVLLPACAILILAAFRVPVKQTLSIGLLISIVCSLLFQRCSVIDVLRAMVLGYSSESPELGGMMNGGGLTAMIRTGAIVLIASCYAGVFRKTPLLDGLQSLFHRIAARAGTDMEIFAASLLSVVISCNQTLAIMLTEELCEPFSRDKEAFALALEDTAVVIAAIVPWSIACSAVLAFIGAPYASIGYAVYLYLIPLWHLLWCRKHTLKQ